MQLFKNIIATVMIGGVLAWLIFGSNKSAALGAAIVAVFLLRFLVVERGKT